MRKSGYGGFVGGGDLGKFGTRVDGLNCLDFPELLDFLDFLTFLAALELSELTDEYLPKDLLRDLDFE